MEIKIGCISHYYDRIGVAVLSLTDSLQLGDMVHIIGSATDVAQEIASMEIEHEKVSAVSPGDEVALKVIEPVRKGDTIYKIILESS